MSIPVSVVRQGGFYVNDKKGLVREVWLVSETGRVHWRGFRLESGAPTNDFCACSPERIAKWASREATSKEIIRMDTQSANEMDRDSARDLMERLLGTVAPGVVL